MRFTHWFWDFDGTLFDTYPRIVRAFQKGLKQLGIEKTDSEVFSLAKRTLAEAAAVIGGEQAAERLMDLYYVHAEEEGPDTLKPYEGLEPVLDFIRRSGGHSYLYTHRDKSGPEALEREGLLGYFDDSVTHDDGFPSKPAPDALLHLVRRHGLDPKDCVMVGDRPIDLEAGRNAGMSSLLFDGDGAYPAYPGARRFESYSAMLEALRSGEL